MLTTAGVDERGKIGVRHQPTAKVHRNALKTCRVKTTRKASGRGAFPQSIGRVWGLYWQCKGRPIATQPQTIQIVTQNAERFEQRNA